MINFNTECRIILVEDLLTASCTDFLCVLDYPVILRIGFCNVLLPLDWSIAAVPAQPVELLPTGDSFVLETRQSPVLTFYFCLYFVLYVSNVFTTLGQSDISALSSFLNSDKLYCKILYKKNHFVTLK